MNFVGELLRVRDELRGYAEQRMTSRVTVRRRKTKSDGTPEWTTDADGYEHQAWLEVATGVPFRLSAQRGAATYRRESVAGTEVEVAALTGNMPAGTVVTDGDLLDITSGEKAGLALEVLESTVGEQATATRVPVIEVARPEEW